MQQFTQNRQNQEPQIQSASKWDKLSVELQKYIKEHLDEDNRFTKPVSTLLKDFADLFDTTYASTSFYYYNEIKFKIEKEIGELKPYTVNGVRPRNMNSNNNQSNVSNGGEAKVDGLIQYIESETDYNVSDSSKEVMEEMVNRYGGIKTMIAIADVIDNIDEMDIFNAIVKEAQNKMQQQ